MTAANAAGSEKGLKMNGSKMVDGKIRVKVRNGKVGRPSTLENPQMVSMRWPKDTVKAAKVTAARQQISMSEYVRRLVMADVAAKAEKTSQA